MEKWKDIKGYEGLYQISNSGNVRTCENKITYTVRHGERRWKQRVLKQSTASHGYNMVALWLNGSSKKFLVHRLVANAFLEKQIGKDIINHKDGNKTNNNVSNLEWCDYADNIRHAHANKLNTACKNIVLIDKTSGEKHKFISMSEASVFLGKGRRYVSGLLSKGKHETNKYFIERE